MLERHIFSCIRTFMYALISCNKALIHETYIINVYITYYVIFLTMRFSSDIDYFYLN